MIVRCQCLSVHFTKVITGNNVFIVSVIIQSRLTFISGSFYTRCWTCPPNCCWTTHS